jgi:hypothetical protein
MKKLLSMLKSFLTGKRRERVVVNRMPLNLQFFAEGGDGGQGGGDGSGGGDGGQGGTGGQGGDNGGQGDNKSFTQDELNRILAKQKKEWQQTLEEEKKKAAMTETERLKAEKDEADKKAQLATEAANNRIIQAEAKAEALGLGIKADKVHLALKLADLSGVEVDANGVVDNKAVQAAINAVLKDLPELKGAAQQQQGGQDFSGGNGQGEKPKTLGEALKLRFAK